MQQAAVDAWLALAVTEGLILPPTSVIASESGSLLVTASIVVAQQPVEILVDIPADFPLHLPEIVLQQADCLGYLPHVGLQLGLVCFADKEGLLLDRQHPEWVLTWSVERAIATLTDALANREAEFMRELEVYWSKLQGETITNFHLPTGTVALLTRYQGDKHRWVAGSEQELPRAFRQIKERTAEPDTTYLPLLPGTTFVPPQPTDPFWTLEQLQAVVAPTLAAMPHKRRRQLFKKSGCWKGLLVLAVPQDDTHYSLIGIAYDSVRGLHPFDERATAKSEITLRPVIVRRWEQSYVVPRGGGHVSLAGKRVLLIGCGAIGGFLVFELARAGVQFLTLVDMDLFDMVNMHRHVLGWTRQGQYKTDALRDELHRHFLYSEVTSVPKSIEKALADGDVRFESFDLVLAATGEATLELYLNEQLRALAAAPPVLYTWLEPYGLGGHALLTQPALPGCLRCVYAREAATSPLVNQLLFAKAGQHFSVALSGCGSLHTPYGAQDASQTATLAARLAIDALTGEEQGNPVYSWKGNKRAFKAAGFKVSARYALSEEALRKDARRYVNPECPVCGRSFSPAA
jgi:molybdopterin-synthase adenylyltransferase